MQSLPFDKPGRFWKGNLHAHSTRSDGLLSPHEICQRYREAGYDFLSLTDHFLPGYGFPLTDTELYRHSDFTTIFGAELHSGSIENGDMWHILAVGLPLDYAQPDPNESGPDAASRAMAHGAFVAVAHPHWYNASQRDVAALSHAHAVEVFNGIAIDANDCADSWPLLDILSDQGLRYFAIAADDSHINGQFHDFGRAWVQVRAESLTPPALLDALKAGHFYASTGPEIYDIHLTDDRMLHVRSSAAERIFVSGRSSTARRAWDVGITEAEFDLSDFNSPWLRVTVRDRNGGRAWSNPIWFDEPFSAS